MKHETFSNKRKDCLTCSQYGVFQYVVVLK